MLKDIRRLINLQELKKFSVGENDDGLKLGQLKDLTQLHGALRIHNLENVVDGKEAQRAGLKNKVRLKELFLEWNDGKDVDKEEKVIEGLQPHESLKILKISGYHGARSPSWLMPKVLSNLEKLELIFCKGWDDNLPFVGQRLNLIKLVLRSMPALKQLSHEFEGKCFPKLEVLKLLGLRALEEWSWTKGKDLFPCMRELSVINCTELKRLPPFPPSLEILEIRNCPKLILNSKTEEDEESGFHLPPSLKVIDLNNCGEYAKLVSDCQHNLHLVTRLELIECPHLTSIPLVQLVELQCLCVSECDELRRMEGLGLLKSLVKLKIVGCPNLVLSNVEDEHAEGSLSSLRILFVDNTALLKMFPLRNSLPFITQLEIESCSEDVIFEEAILVQSLTAVRSLNFSKCMKLQISLPTALRSLPFLEDLFIFDCPRIQAMPEEGFPTSLLSVRCSGDVHPTLKEQAEKFMRDGMARRMARRLITARQFN